jgi:hypothetical protein
MTLRDAYADSASPIGGRSGRSREWPLTPTSLDRTRTMIVWPKVVETRVPVNAECGYFAVGATAASLPGCSATRQQDSSGSPATV